MGTFLNQPWAYLASAVFAALILLYIHTRPHRPGVRWFSWLMGVYLVWAVAAALSNLAPPIPVLYGLFVLQSVCSLGVTALELMVVLEYTGSEKWIAWRANLLLFLPPLLLALMAFSFPAVFAYIEVHSGIPMFFGRPVLKWGFYAYVVIMFSISSGVLLTRLMLAPAFWAPILLLMLGAIFPVISFALIRPEWVTVPPIQVAVLLTNVAMLIYFVALYGFRILQVIPVARDMVISRMPYGLVVLDSENRLVDFNAAAQALPGLPGKLILQQPASQALGSWWDRLTPLIGSERSSQDFIIGIRILHVTSLALLQPSGWRLGQVFVVEDVTQARQAQRQQEQALRSLAALQERERLARELHDSLGQTLAATHLQASTARLLLAQGEITETEKCLEQMADTALAAEVDVREYLLGAKTVFSSDGHFFEALRRYVMQFSQQYHLPVELSVPPEFEEQGLSAAAEVQLMRIIQEGLSNIRKHARATKAQVIFTDAGRQIQIAIIDNGQGFDPASVAARQAAGFGLQSMRERAEALDGCLDVISQPGQGTQVLVRLQVEEVHRGEEFEK